MTSSNGTVICAIWMLIAGVASTEAAAEQEEARRPNVIVIVSDDAGYADFSMHGSQEIPTPRIDSIAAQGVRFSHGYVTASVCSPSRAGLITGRYQQRFGHELNIPPRYSEENGLPVDEVTLANALRDGGYRTIALGKWHLGYADHFHPLSRGFDDFFGFLQGARSYWPIRGTRLNRLLRDRDPISEDFTYMTDELGVRAAAYIAKHRERPFFMYLCYNAVHTPLHAKEADLAAFGGVQKKRRRQLGAMTKALDDSVGTVLDALSRLGLAENTLLFFVNDNGGARNNASSNAPLRGQKGSPFEGGIRVPFLVRWPGQLPAGRVHDTPVSTLDIFPTVLAAAGISARPAKPLDGIDLLPQLTDAAPARPRTLYWRRGQDWAIRDGDLKLLRQGRQPPHLFDLASDPRESRNLASERPEDVDRLGQRHRAWAATLAEPRWRRSVKEKRAPEEKKLDQEKKPRKRTPNILWIIGEDLGPELSCYGTPGVRTPNLDGLAARGVRYTHAFTTSPVCSASRSAFMTGMYQTSIGAHNHRSHRNDGHPLPEGVRLLTDRLRDAEYFTANVRHLGDDPAERFYRGTGKTDWNFHHEGAPFDSDRWSDLAKHEPFYAQVNFAETHRGPSWNTAHEHIEHPADPAEVVVPPYYPDHPLVRKDWAQYLNAVMALDKKVGFVLQQLEKDGLADRTVVFFFGDHGRAMVRGKQWPYDSGLRIPLIIYWPPGIPRPAGLEVGGVSDRLIAAIDFTATTLAIAEIEPPRGMQGRVFLGERASPPRHAVFGARDRCDETVFRIRTVRDARYRYIRNFMPERPFLQLNRYKEWAYPVLGLMRTLHEEKKLGPLPSVLFAPSRPPEELYDLADDPHETRNLAGSADHQVILERMRADTKTWIEDSHDHGRVQEPTSVVKEWTQKMKKNYDARLQERKSQL